jgi:hypothetical protein
VTSQLTHEEFLTNLKTRFQVQAEPDRYVDLELVEVSEPKRSPRQEQFSIVLRGPTESFLDQRTHTFRHESMGQFELFIVPISQDDKGFYYEAIFNRFREPTQTA